MLGGRVGRRWPSTGWRQINDRKPLLPCGGSQTIVERYQLQSSGPPLGTQECGGKLKRVGCTERVNAKKPRCRFADRIARIDLMPACGELPKPFERKDDGLRRRESAVTFEPGHGGNAL